MQAAVLSMEATPEGIFLLPSNGKRLLVRSLSDGAKYGSSIRRRLAQQAEESELYTMSESGNLKDENYISSETSSSSSLCSCGCGDVPSLNEVEVDSSDDDDEGFAKDYEEEEEECGPKSVVYVDSAERRSFSSSVDSGRSSDRDGSLNKNDHQNKISVFVPYCEVEDDHSPPSQTDNVIICNTQVRLRINCSNEKDVSSTDSITPLQTSQYHRRKDLCKLLGLSENDASSMKRVREAQKLALRHLNENLPARIRPTSGKKKNLAKFLGVSENSDFDEPIPFEEFKLRVEEKKVSPSRGNFIRNLFKTSSSTSFASVARSHQSVESSEIPDKETVINALLNRSTQEGKHRKDLTKFLGLNDSDSEEIIFIQNKRKREDATYEGFTIRKSSSCASLNSSPISIRHTRRRRSSSSSVGAKETVRKGILHKRNPGTPIPCRKSVLFKEYDFSVEESIAKGLPIIPSSGGRKKKKDARRRFEEVSKETSLEELLRAASLSGKKISKRKRRKPGVVELNYPILSYDPKGRVRIIPNFRNSHQYFFQFVRGVPNHKDYSKVQRTIVKR